MTITGVLPDAILLARLNPGTPLQSSGVPGYDIIGVLPDAHFRHYGYLPDAPFRRYGYLPDAPFRRYYSG